MKKLFFLLAIVIFCLLQIAIFDYFKIFGVKPDFLLICTVGACIYFNPRWSLAFGIFAGILKDSFGTNAYGLNTILFTLWTWFAIKISQKITLDNYLVRAVFIFLIVILNDIIIKFIFFLSGNFVPLRLFLKVTFIESLYTALASLWAFKACERLVYFKSSRY